MTDSSRKKLLLGLLGLLLVIFGWQQLPDFSSSSGNAAIGPGETSRPRRGRNTRRARNAVQQPKEVHELLLDALYPEPTRYQIGRNLWAFYEPPPPPPPPVYVPPPPPPPEIPVETGPRPPTIRFTYLGSFGPKDRRIAVLAEGDELINALEGDIVKNSFRVARIGYESVYIEYVDFPDVQAAQLKVGG